MKAFLKGRSNTPTRRGRTRSDVLVVGLGIGFVLILFCAWFASRRVGSTRVEDEVRNFPTDHPSVSQIDLSAAGHTAVTCGGDSQVRVWDFTDGQLTETIAVDPSRPTCVALSLDDAWLCVGTESGELLVWDRKAKKLHRRIHAHGSAIRAVALHPSGLFAATAADTAVRYWSTDDGEKLHEYRHTAPVNAVAVAPFGNFLLTGSDLQLSLWSIGKETPLLSLSDHQATINSVAFSRDGKRAVSADQSGSVLLWDLETGTFMQSLQRPEKETSCVEVAFSPGGSRVLAGFADGELCLWYTGDGSVLKQLGDPAHGSVAGVRFAPSGLLAVCANQSGPMRVWRLPTPTGAELTAARDAVDQLEAHLKTLDNFRELMEQGRSAVDKEERQQAARLFRQARELVNPHSHEFGVADKALMNVREADQYVDFMESGKEAMEAGKFSDASRVFAAASAVLPDRQEARDAKKTADDLVEIESLFEEASKDLQFVFDSNVSSKETSESGRYVFALTSDRPPMGEVMSPALWKFSINAKRAFPATKLRCRLSLIDKRSGARLGVSEHSFAPASVQEWVGSAEAPMGKGWLAGEYQFASQILFDGREEDFGEPTNFNMGLVDWQVEKLSVEPRKVQQSNYAYPTPVKLEKGDGLMVKASGSITPAPLAFYRKLLKDDRRRDPQATGPEGVKQSLGNANLAQYLMVANELPWGALLYRLNDGGEEIAWNYFAIPKLAEKQCTVELSINSVQAIWSAGFKRIPTEDATFWAEKSGSFEVQACRAQFRGKFEMNDLLKMYLMQQLAE